MRISIVFLLSISLRALGSSNVMKISRQLDVKPTGDPYVSWTVRSPLECATACGMDPYCGWYTVVNADDGRIACSHFDCWLKEEHAAGDVTFKRTVDGPCPCPPGYSPSPAGNCYLFVDTAMPWAQARDICPGTHPEAFIWEAGSAEENEFVSNFTGNYVWLGAQGSPGNWSWDHSGLNASFTNFGDGELNTTGSCVAMMTYLWYTDWCTSDHRVVCELGV